MSGRVSTRVFLLDDHEIVRHGLRTLLEIEDDIEVVGEAGTAAEGLAGILELRPDVAVLDARLPDGSGIEVGRAARAEAPEVRTLVLTSYDDDQALMSAFRAGASGFVLKEIGAASLVSGVRAVADGRSLIDPAVTTRMLDRMREDETQPSGLESLTERERSILELIAEGLTNKEIGQRLYLAEKTIKNQVTGILGKLGLQRRTQAAVLGARLGSHATVGRS